MTSKIWDVVVIGGGPAGMMAAGRAGAMGKSVLLLEKNASLGKKLLITGGGRCNVTNNKRDTRTMLANYKKNDKFLFSPFSRWSVADTLRFFNERGMPTKEENEGRMFPVSNSAQSVWDVLVGYMNEGKVKVEAKAEVSGISVDKETGEFEVTRKGKPSVRAKSCIVATGGTSRPETGSTGQGYVWMRKLGHTIKENDFALVPVALADAWAKRLGGVTLSDVKLTTFQNKKKQESRKGKLLFTHFGISGPMVLNMSREIGELLRYGDVSVELDLFPSLDHGALRKELQALLVKESNKKLKNTLGVLVKKAMVPSVLALARIDGETANHSVRSGERAALVAFMKAVPLHVAGLLGADKAVVSSGGVIPEEIDWKTMQSRKVRNLFIVGDMLDIDRPSGGYSLQLCWTTGQVAGSNA